MIFLEKYYGRTALMIFMITCLSKKSYSENAIRGVPNTLNTQYTEASENRSLSKKLDMMKRRLSFEKSSEIKSEETKKLLNDLGVVFHDIKEVIDNPAAGSNEKILEGLATSMIGLEPYLNRVKTDMIMTESSLEERKHLVTTMKSFNEVADLLEENIKHGLSKDEAESKKEEFLLKINEIVDTDRDDTEVDCGAGEGCTCRTDMDCNSGRCEGYGLTGTCHNRLDNGESCNEATDCKSHYCNGSWNGQCAELVRSQEGEWCTDSYVCEDGFHCGSNWGCTSNKELVEATTGQTCDGASNTNNEIKVMSYNVFLLHDWGMIGHAGGLLARPEEARRAAVTDISNWLRETKTDVDVILVQEQFDLTEEFKAGMVGAGYCNSVTDERTDRVKSGLAIFSKHPVVDYDFWYWCDKSSWTPMCGGGAEAAADKGILYAKINVNGNIVHVTNTHTTSDSLGDAHSVRMLQFEYHVTMMTQKNPNNDALTLMGGDFNENYYDHHEYDEDTDSYTDTSASAYYTEMLPALNAKEIPLVGDGRYTYDSVTNPVLHEVYEEREHDGEYRERLDYIFPVDGTISDANLASSSCQILNTVTYSDHYPVECTITIS